MKAARALVCAFLLAISLFATSSVSAEEECACKAGLTDLECNKEKQACWTGKINEKQQQANTLGNVISVLNGKIVVQELQIKQTKLEISKLETEIGQLGERISGLNQSLDRQTDILIERVSENYKRLHTNPLGALLISDSLTSFFTKYKYLQVAQEHTTQIMQDAENQKQTYDQEKLLKEQKQDEINKKKVKLQAQEADLTRQRTEQQTLLTQTKNDEARYQQLLAQAQAEVSSFQSFTSGLGLGVLPPQNSPDGWFFSQRDERWAGACIGNSCGTRNQATIMEVGCLISSTAMIKKKYGEDTNPLVIARNPSYFFSTTAYMLQPWPTPGGYTYVRTGPSQSKIDSELAEGRPVIVHLRINNRDGHFIVLKSGSGGNYTMHDPVEGYDKSFTQFYRFSQVDSMAYLVKK